MSQGDAASSTDGKTRVPAEWPTPAARYVAAVVLGIGSLAGLGLSLTRTPLVEGRRVAASEARSVEPSGGDSDTRAASETPAVIGRLDLNRATKAELEMLPGVGPALADRIIADREANGAFATVGDLDRVKGIGPRMLERLRGLVRVGD